MQLELVLHDKEGDRLTSILSFHPDPHVYVHVRVHGHAHVQGIALRVVWPGIPQPSPPSHDRWPNPYFDSYHIHPFLSSRSTCS